MWEQKQKKTPTNKPFLQSKSWYCRTRPASRGSECMCKRASDWTNTRLVHDESSEKHSMFSWTRPGIKLELDSLQNLFSTYITRSCWICAEPQYSVPSCETHFRDTCSAVDLWVMSDYVSFRKALRSEARALLDILRGNDGNGETFLLVSGWCGEGEHSLLFLVLPSVLGVALVHAALHPGTGKRRRRRERREAWRPVWSRGAGRRAALGSL